MVKQEKFYSANISVDARKVIARAGLAVGSILMITSPADAQIPPPPGCEYQADGGGFDCGPQPGPTVAPVTTAAPASTTVETQPVTTVSPQTQPVLTTQRKETTIRSTTTYAPATTEIVVSTTPWEVDGDMDGLPDLFEEELGTKADKADTDGDGIEDGEEIGVQWRSLDFEDYVPGTFDKSTLPDANDDGTADVFDPLNDTTTTTTTTDALDTTSTEYDDDNELAFDIDESEVAMDTLVDDGNTNEAIVDSTGTNVENSIVTSRNIVLAGIASASSIWFFAVRRKNDEDTAAKEPSIV